MKRGWLSLVLCGVAIVESFGCIVGCNGRVSDGDMAGGGSDGGSSGQTDGGTAAADAAGPYRITCSVYHRDLGAGVNEHARTPIVFMTDEPAEKSVDLPDDSIPVRAKLAPATDAPGLVDLTIAFPRSNLEQHFRLEREHMPPYELLGYHGFTGLNYVSTPGSSVDVQFVCEASPRDEERPKPLPGPGSNDEPPQSPPPPSTPFRVRCETASGEPSNASSDSFVLEGKTERTLTLGDQQVALFLYDDPYEGGRSFVVRIPGVLQQLYQLDRTKPVTDATRGPGGLTGRTIVRSLVADGGDAGDGNERGISLACGAAPN